MADLSLAAAGIVLSPFLQAFFETMESGELDAFFRGRKLNDVLLRRLKMALLSVNAVLDDAEDKQFTKPDVRQWLDELKDAIYDAEDILDEIATKDLVRKLDAEFETIACKVRNPISISGFVKKVERKIKELLYKLEDLARHIDALGLGEGGGRQPLERLPTTSLVDESSIFGRHDDKEAIINSLLSDGASGNETSVIAIVGMGGIGKTTLAQLVYKDQRVKEHFDLTAWVCVSDPFDVFKVMKTIIEYVSCSHFDIKDLDQLQNELKEKLTGKKFLLVLDDVWEKNYAKWEVLSNALKFGAQGSKVIVTTRDYEVSAVMHAGATHLITELSIGDCWSLFVKYAFHDDNSDAHPELEAIGRQIVEKCKGLPLAIKAIGALLRSKLDIEDWNKVLGSKEWDLSMNRTYVLPALGLSYKYLPSDLKRCFAYCSIFPKDYVFKKDTLVLLWMAEGFLPQPKNKTIEEVGDVYFFALVSRSLFQQSNHNAYIMPNLVFDLAKFISTGFALSHENDCSLEIESNTRHLSYFYTKFYSKDFANFDGAKKLHTILQLNYDVPSVTIYEDVSQFSLPVSRCLRVLSLSHYQNITKLPNSIGKLIHLRYLDLSYTKIKRLPDSICKLCNLQILNLSNCWYLAALPRDLHKLINLRHLDFAQTKIIEMPINLGQLKCLRTLTKFIVGKHGGSGIGQLGGLGNLRGSLPIVELQNVESPTDARDVNLSEKYLKELVLEWRVDTNVSDSQILVLDSFQPHRRLEILAINGYGGKSFPDWVGRASFSHIKSIRLEYCIHCSNLPPLGQLPSLQDLSIVGFQEVVKVGREFYGSGHSSNKPFGALKVLRFILMLKWEEWFSFDTENEGGAFPNLREVQIYECPMLTGCLPIHLRSEAELCIRDCPKLEASIPSASS